MSVSEFNASLESFGTDPVRIHKAQLKLIELAYANELDLVDPTNPFIKLMELNAVSTAAWFRRDEQVLRKIYASMAQDYSDLYRHMSNEDYIGRFSSPAADGVFKLHFHESELIAKAVPVGDTGARKLIIPRFTTIQIAETTFTLQYPIEIRVMAHGGLRVVYDTTVVSPLQSLETNGLDWMVSLQDGLRILIIDVPLWQFTRTVYSDTITPSTPFKKTYSLDDQFYHCRVYGVGTNGTKREYQVTHSEEVYDPRNVTALLQVSERGLTVEIPAIYYTNGLVSTRIQIEIFTTIGQLRLDLGSYNTSAYVVSWGDDYNQAGDSIYSAPLTTLEIVGVYSISLIDSGANGLDFTTLQQRVIDNATKISLPITDAQLRAKLSLRGYDLLLSTDDLTTRTYLATRNLPTGVNDAFTVGASCSIDTVQSTLAFLTSLPTVKDNVNRITIMPNTLYRYEAGVPKLVGLGQRPDQLAATTDALLAMVNENQYAYSPFHYVLDTNFNSFEVRPYYLDSPEILGRVFIAENDTTQLSVSTRQYLIERDDFGYRLLISSKVGTNYAALPIEDLYVQLRFRPNNERDWAYVNGTFINELDGDYYWEFRLDSTFDIDENDRIILSNFAMYIEAPRDFATDLTSSFEIIYAVADYSIVGLRNSDIDNVLGRHLLPADVIGITYESATISLGYAMKSLWTMGRSIAGDLEYQRYEADIPWLWETNVLKRNPDGSIFLEVVGGEIQHTVLHRQGDPKLDDVGEILYKHRKGDVVRDDSGNPIEITTRQTQRQYDVFLVDGSYYYVNNDTDSGYRNSIGPSVVGFLKNDLDAMQNTLLENTRLFYQPKKTLGNVGVITEAGIRTNIASVLSFEVRYFLSTANYTNFELRRSIEVTTSRVINEVLRKATVSVSELVDRLRDELGNDVIAIDFNKLGPNADITAYTAIDDGNRCSVKRKLMQLPNGDLALIEDIQVSFVRHLA